ncbi:methyltransferase domain-containing protein [Actinospica sp. MGRD01-02]|uniref:Methyltransferase domain-containing protein n=1 Tax=Actinospica acidithermotolerans TaxID=2828514 RepID=A0A941EG35_9ACTN|nr:methyltransferase domain-containing protein [Actinospica acidithermotolerans]MBR7829758.1 methyltransferase domain-containing protein [Actinospica acidithermotolerans]
MAAERTQPGTSARTGVVWEVLVGGLARLAGSTGGGALDVVDLGGGTGGFAVPLARLGHRVTVVDPSPDALASLERRADEEGVSERVRAVQGDLGSVFDAVAKESADAVLCHGVLEVADDPVEGMGAAARVLRPGGLASVLAASRDGLVVARALNGNVAGALTALHGPTPRRFTEDALVELVVAAGLDVVSQHGVLLFADLVPTAAADDPDLIELELATASRPEFRALATRLHVLASRPGA